MSWDAARKHCNEDGALLARVGNELVNAYIELLALKGRLWIGINKMEVQGRKPLELHIANTTNLCMLLENDADLSEYSSKYSNNDMLTCFLCFCPSIDVNIDGLMYIRSTRAKYYKRKCSIAFSAVWEAS